MNLAVDIAGEAIDTAVAALNGDVRMGPATDSQPMPPTITQAALSSQAAEPVAEAPSKPVATTNPKTVMKVQQGLANLGFLHGEIDGVRGRGDRQGHPQLRSLLQLRGHWSRHQQPRGPAY